MNEYTRPQACAIDAMPTGVAVKFCASRIRLITIVIACPDSANQQSQVKFLGQLQQACCQDCRSDLPLSN